MFSRSLLVLPRLFLGVIFGIAVRGKLTAAVPFKTILLGFLTQMLPNAHPLYQSFARAAVLPNAGIVAVLVIIGELYVALAMIFGITTRLAALVAVCLLTNYMLTKGMNLWTPASNDAADIILAIVVGIGAAGRVWGIDRVLAERFPRVPLW
ncbi:MAG: DoxX family membrane protein [Candidatus Eremiobacteraeota bacterium]|nr:DoxX family membrane protein [Candidatus Eremiobacteraeota bacterium]